MTNLKAISWVFISLRFIKKFKTQQPGGGCMPKPNEVGPLAPKAPSKTRLPRVVINKSIMWLLDPGSRTEQKPWEVKENENEPPTKKSKPG